MCRKWILVWHAGHHLHFISFDLISFKRRRKYCAVFGLIPFNGLCMMTVKTTSLCYLGNMHQSIVGVFGFIMLSLETYSTGCSYALVKMLCLNVALLWLNCGVTHRTVLCLLASQSPRSLCSVIIKQHHVHQLGPAFTANVLLVLHCELNRAQIYSWFYAS